MKGPAHIAIASVVLLTFAVIESTGCSRWKQKPMALDSVACMYDRAAIVYQVDASRLGLPLTVSKVEAQHVSYQESPSAPQPGNSTGTLIVKYPHPQARPETALAEVVIDSRPKGVTRTTDAIREVWTMDIPKNDLDRIVGRLRDTRYFQNEGRGEEGVRLTTSLDKVTMDKEWQQVPELNLLMQHVRSHGQLVAYNRPTAGLASTAIQEPSKSRFARWFGKSAAPVQAATVAQFATHAEAKPTQIITYDRPPTSLPNPVYAGIGGQAQPAQANNAPFAAPAYQMAQRADGTRSVPATMVAAPAYQTAPSAPAAKPALPGVSVSGANAVYGGRSIPKPEGDNMSPALKNAMQQSSQMGGMGGGGGGF